MSTEKIHQEVVDDYARGCIAEVEIDYIPLWGISKYFRDNVKILSIAEVKANSLAVVQKLIDIIFCRGT